MNPADLLDRIEDAAVTGDVEQALLLCQKLAGNADSSDLRDWAQQELEGYSRDAFPPDYRRLRGGLYGNGAQPFRRVSRIPIAMDAVPRVLQVVLDAGVPVFDSISQVTLEASEDMVTLSLPRMTKYMDDINSRSEGIVFDQLYIGVRGSAYSGIITAVRSRIVNFVAALRSTSSVSDRLSAGDVASAVSTAISSPAINVTGDNNRVTVSDSGNANSETNTKKKITEQQGGRRSWLRKVAAVATIVGAVVASLTIILDLL